MVDWELMVPGMGLTVLGLAGVALSLAGIAKTFVEGMHAISALMMFIGMIILATGILKDGLPRSAQAKAAAVVIIGLLVSLGTFLMGSSTVQTLPLLAGMLLLIFVPAAVIAYAAKNQSQHFKAISILFVSASLVGGITFISFGFAVPKPIEAGVLEQPEVQEPAGKIAGPVFEISILKGSSVKDSPAYGPAEANVERGLTVVWANDDSTPHTVTSGVDFDDPAMGVAFDSGPINGGKTFALDTSKLDPGEYSYFCTLHPYMQGKFTVIVTGSSEPVEEPEAPAMEEEAPSMMEEHREGTAVSIVLGAVDPNNPEFYKPGEITVDAGTTITWTNDDKTGHTVTSGIGFDDPDMGVVFDSGFPLMKTDETFEYMFDAPGEYPYFCQVHPHMTGKVIVTP